MFIILAIYFTALFLAPQLWLEPFIGLRTDYIFFPIWILYAATRQTSLTLEAQDKLLLLFYIWVIISILINGFSSNVNAIPMIVNYTRYLLIYFLVRKTITNQQDVALVAKFIMFFVGLLVLEGIQHKLSPDGIGIAGQTLAWVDPSVLRAGGTGRIRWVNIFDGPGVFCVVYTLALPFILRYLDREYPFKVKFLSLFLLAPLLLATYYTGSRGGLLASVAIIALYTAIRSKISFAKIIRASIFISVIFVMAPSHLTSVRDENKSAQKRVTMWFEGVEMLQQNPVFGIGRGNFKSYTSSKIAHNSAIEIMGEMGFVGLFLWGGLIYLAFKNILIVAKSTNDARLLSLNQAVGLSILGMLVGSMFVTLEYETFYLLLALPAALSNSVGKRAEFNAKDKKQLFIILLLWVIVLKSFIMIY